MFFVSVTDWFKRFFFVLALAPLSVAKLEPLTGCDVSDAAAVIVLCDVIGEEVLHVVCCVSSVNLRGTVIVDDLSYDVLSECVQNS